MHLSLQVAHFYNSIDSQMIPSQQALMLKSAMAFEHLIKFSNLVDPQKEKSLGSAGSGSRITWQMSKEVPAFISQLQAAARNLMEENRQLRKVHYELIAKVIMNIVLICHELWVSYTLKVCPLSE